MILKSGDKVCYKNDPDKEIYTVYQTYEKNKVSLGLLDYPDTEQDYLTDMKELIKIKK